MKNAINQKYKQLEWYSIYWYVVIAMINNPRKSIYMALATDHLKKARSLQKLMMKSIKSELSS